MGRGILSLRLGEESKIVNTASKLFISIVLTQNWIINTSVSLPVISWHLLKMQEIVANSVLELNTTEFLW